jgi:hypothetical protein
MKKSPIIAIVALFLMSFVAFFLLRPGKPQAELPLLYFTIDDGKTWFEADINQIPPFQYDGKEAVQAMMFSPDGTMTGAQPAYLLKYSEPVRDRFLEAIKTKGSRSSVEYGLKPTEIFVKRPGEAEWMTKAQAQANGFLKSIQGRAVIPE